MTYTLMIAKDGELIVEKEISADEVIDMMASSLREEAAKPRPLSVRDKTKKRGPYKTKGGNDSHQATEAARRHPATEQIEKMLIEGLGTAAIMEQIDVSAPTIPFESTKEPTKYAGFYGFRVGTCEGLWRSTKRAYEILSVINKQPGNGHFKQVMLWFEQSCRRDGKVLIIRECWNANLAAMLRKHAFKRRGKYDWHKKFV